MVWAPCHWFLYRVPLRHSERRSGWPRRSSRTDLFQTGSDTRLTTKLGTTLRGETGEEPSLASEHMRLINCSSCLFSLTLLSTLFFFLFRGLYRFIRQLRALFCSLFSHFLLIFQISIIILNTDPTYIYIILNKS